MTTTAEETLIPTVQRITRQHLGGDLSHGKALTLVRLSIALRNAEAAQGVHAQGRVAGLRLAVSIHLGCTHDEARAIMHDVKRHGKAERQQATSRAVPR